MASCFCSVRLEGKAKDIGVRQREDQALVCGERSVGIAPYGGMSVRK